MSVSEYDDDIYDEEDAEYDRGGGAVQYCTVQHSTSEKAYHL